MEKPETLAPTPTQPKSVWKPSLSPKQHKLMALCHRRPGAPKFVLVSGPRYSTKSVGCCHAIADYLWTVPDARFAVVSPTVSAADDYGIWTDLCEKVMPEWIDAKFGMEWITEPRQKGRTKRVYFQVTNKFGGKSHCHLDSLQFEHDAEGRFKNKNYTGIYVSELSYYKKRETFDTWIMALRGKGYLPWQFFFLGDTNPAEEGKNSWIWKLWWEERLREATNEREMMWQRQLELMEFQVADNIFMDEDWHKQQSQLYAHSQDLMRRYYHGEWVVATDNSTFHDSFIEEIHVKGEWETATNPDPEIIVPNNDCTELITGWDAGVTNSAFHILNKRWTQRVIREKREGKEVLVSKDVSVFDVIDEVVYLKSDEDLDDFVAECMERVQFWEDFLGHTVFWRNWSDRSAFDMRGGLGNVYHHQLIRNITEGKIILQAADRRPGSIRQRVDLVKKLLYENRIFVCRSRCPHLIESFQGLPPGRAGAVLNKESHFKHAFDSFSYAVVSECYDEILRSSTDSPNIKRASDRLVMVPM